MIHPIRKWQSRWNTSVIGLAVVSLAMHPAGMAATEDATLTDAERQDLARITCIDMGSVVAQRVREPPIGLVVDIQCTGHAHYLEHPVGRSMHCRRAPGELAWSCNAPVPTVDIRLSDGNTARVAHPSVTVAEAVDIVQFISQEPKFAHGRIQRAWLHNGATIYKVGTLLHVDAGRYQIMIERTKSAPRVTGVSECALDVCRPADLEYQKPMTPLGDH